jgi:hypothetical protein
MIRVLEMFGTVFSLSMWLLIIIMLIQLLGLFFPIEEGIECCLSF